MRARVIKHAVDGVAPGGIVELVDNLANRTLITAGVIEPLEPLPEQVPPKGVKPSPKSELADLRARFDASWAEAQRRIVELEGENADLRAQLAAKKPSKKTDAPTQE